MKFEYTKFTNEDGTVFYRPIIQILFKNDDHFIYTEGIVDSGSDHIILPIEFAGELNLKLDPKNKKSFLGAGNNKFDVYPSPKSLELVLRQSGFRTIKWKAPIYFAESQISILLGHIGFLDRFKLTLNGVKKEIQIDTPKS